MSLSRPEEAQRPVVRGKPNSGKDQDKSDQVVDSEPFAKYRAREQRAKDRDEVQERTRMIGADDFHAGIPCAEG
jgi:hypothetical protein